MRIDISMLPALAAAFMLGFARIRAMVMLLPGWERSTSRSACGSGSRSHSTLILLPLQRSDYHVNMTTIAPMLVLLVHEIIIRRRARRYGARDTFRFGRGGLGDRAATRARFRHKR